MARNSHDGPMAQEHSAPGVDHLQRAAHELIAAAREFLDAAEDLVDDRDVVSEVAGLFSGVVREFGSLGARARRAGGRPFEADLDDRDREGGAGAWGDPEDNVSSGEAASDTISGEEQSDGVTGAAKAAPGGRATRRVDPRPTTPRVRRIDVE